MQAVVDTAVELVSDPASTDSARVAIARLMVEQEMGDPSMIADVIRPIVEREHLQAGGGDGGYDWDWLRGTWKLLADAKRRAGHEEASNKALLVRAETYSTQARWLAAKGAGATLGAHLLRDGIEALRDLPGTEETRKVLHRELRDVQQSLIAEMQRFEGPAMDLTDVAHRAMEAVTGSASARRSSHWCAWDPRGSSRSEPSRMHAPCRLRSCSACRARSSTPKAGSCGTNPQLASMIRHRDQLR